MMVGTYRQHLACVAAQLNGVKRHRSMKPSSRDRQLGLASPLNYAAIQSGKTKTPLRRRRSGQGLDASLPRGEGEEFLLDILSHRMSVIGWWVGRYGRHELLLMSHDGAAMKVQEVILHALVKKNHLVAGRRNIGISD